MTIDWFALLQVTIVTIIGTAAITGLMSLANWLLLPPKGRVVAEADLDDPSTTTPARRVLGYSLIGVVVLMVLGGMYLLMRQTVGDLLSHLLG